MLNLRLFLQDCVKILSAFAAGLTWSQPGIDEKWSLLGESARKVIGKRLVSESSPRSHGTR